MVGSYLETYYVCLNNIVIIIDDHRENWLADIHT